MRIRTTALVALVLVSWSAVGAGESSDSCTLFVRVADAADDQRLPGAEVTVRVRHEDEGIMLGRDSESISRQLADSNGLVRLDRLSAGVTYYAVGRFPGYSSTYEIFNCAATRSDELVLRLHEFQDVSLVQLIANPAHWDGKYVQVVGFLRLEFEGTALYLHKEDWRKSLVKNAIWVDVDFDLWGKMAHLDKKYVILAGTFDGKRNGHMELFAGELTEITRHDPW